VASIIAQLILLVSNFAKIDVGALCCADVRWRTGSMVSGGQTVKTEVHHAESVEHEVVWHYL
jgi:hypothetical protein